MARKYKDADWKLTINPNGTVPQMDAHLSVLMDIRDQLQELNRILRCPNALDIPTLLRRISKNTAAAAAKRRKRPPFEFPLRKLA